ncbi:MAG TPA: DUF5985 family protein [Tepidisphaeraceae bacterium]|nr:DUF5985 family protein [Tepidisphaeraceae bacterium]
MTETVVVFLQAVSATLAWVSGLLFYRFWRESRDVLFVFFSAGFTVMAFAWVLLAVISPTGEARPYIYAVRLLAFLLLIAGMIQKNRST